MYMKTDNRNVLAWRDLFIVFILLDCYGFPGRYQAVFGTIFRTILDYGAFLLEIALMILSSGDSIMDIRLVDLKKRYIGIYLTVGVITTVSMISTRDRSLEAITCIRLITTAMFAIWLAENFKPKRILEYAYYAEILFTIASIIFVTVFRRYYIRGASYQNDYVGLFNVKNEVASQLSFAILMQMILLKLTLHEGKHSTDIPFFWPVLLMHFFLIFRSHGLGGLFFAAVPAFVLFFFGKQSNRNLRLPIGYIYVVGSVTFILIALTILPLFKPVFDLLGKDVTLTGRTDLWRQIIDVMQKNRTMTGFGYGMFWRDQQAVQLIHDGFDKNSFMGNMTSGAHNTILELWLNAGLLSVVALFFMILYAFRRPGDIPYDSYLFSSTYVLWYMLHGWMERANGNYEYNVLFLFIAIAFACIRDEREIIPFKSYSSYGRRDYGTT